MNEQEAGLAAVEIYAAAPSPSFPASCRNPFRRREGERSNINTSPLMLVMFMFILLIILTTYQTVLTLLNFSTGNSERKRIIRNRSNLLDNASFQITLINLYLITRRKLGIADS